MLPMSVKRHPLSAWLKDMRRMRKMKRGEFSTDGYVAPYRSPLDAAYYQGYLDGYDDFRKNNQQLELFEVKR